MGIALAVVIGAQQRPDHHHGGAGRAGEAARAVPVSEKPVLTAGDPWRLPATSDAARHGEKRQQQQDEGEYSSISAWAEGPAMAVPVYDERASSGRMISAAQKAAILPW